MLVAPEIDAVAPVDGETDPTAEVAETPEIEAERFGAAFPADAVPSLPTRDADASPAESGNQIAESPEANMPHGFLTNSLAAGSGRKSNEITPSASLPFSAAMSDLPTPNP